MSHTEILTKFTWAIFENHWDLLLRDCVERRGKETQKSLLKKVYKNAFCPTNKTSLTNQIRRYFIFWNTRNWSGPLNDENKLQVDEKNNKNWKVRKKLKMYIISSKTIRYKLSALGNIIHSIFNYKLMLPVSN